jgi:hypothetical protein
VHAVGGYHANLFLVGYSGAHYGFERALQSRSGCDVSGYGHAHVAPSQA